MSYEVKKRQGESKYTLLSDRSQSGKATFCMTPCIGYSGEGKAMEKIKSSVVASGVGEGRYEEGPGRNFRAVKILCMM